MQESIQRKVKREPLDKQIAQAEKKKDMQPPLPSLKKPNDGERFLDRE